MKQEVRILYVEDVPADVVMVNHELRRAGLQFRTKRVVSKQDFLHELEHEPPDIILSDHGLPSFDGFTALAIARDKRPDIPFIFVTSSLGEEMTIETFESGATDYVLKSNLGKLVPIVQRALRETRERTALKQKEDALRESEERFRTLVEGVKDYAIFMLDKQGRVTSWNSGAQWIHGYSSEEVTGQHVSIFYAPEDRENSRPQFGLKTAAGEGRFEEEGLRLGKNGRPFWAHVVITALRDPSGKLRGYTQVTRNISEHVRSREALQKSEARYRHLVELLPDALIVVHPDDQIAYCNRAAVQLLGANGPEQLLSRPFRDLFPPEDGRQLLERVRRLREGGLVAPFVEEELVRTDGTRLRVELSALPMVFQDKPAMQVIAHDITARVAANEALRQSEASKSAILETALDAIISIDHEGLVQEWNPAAQRIFGYSRSEALGRPMDELIIPRALREMYQDGLANYLITGAGSLLGRPIELNLRRLDGTEFRAELAISRVPAEEPPRCTALVRDITKQREAEAEIRRLNADLERRVQERTAQLEATNQELEAFSYSVSHDLRSPLRHIAGYVELLQMEAAGRLEAEGQQHLQAIAESARRMGGLIDALLALSKMSRKEMSQTHVGLETLVRQAREELSREIQGRKIEWKIGPLPEVQADAVMLRQVVVNLLSNALKYTRTRAQAEIEIQATDNGQETVLSVRDNGVGFDMKYADKLFGVFQRLHRPSDFEGTGIGLANVRRIIHRHGGRTWAEGSVGHGATFYCSLPHPP